MINFKKESNLKYYIARGRNTFSIIQGVLCIDLIKGKSEIKNSKYALINLLVSV